MPCSCQRRAPAVWTRCPSPPPDSCSLCGFWVMPLCQGRCSGVPLGWEEAWVALPKQGLEDKQRNEDHIQPVLGDKNTTAFPVLRKGWMSGQRTAALQLQLLRPALFSPRLTSTWPTLTPPPSPLATACQQPLLSLSPYPAHYSVLCGSHSECG